MATQKLGKGARCPLSRLSGGQYLASLLYMFYLYIYIHIIYIYFCRDVYFTIIWVTVSLYIYIYVNVYIYCIRGLILFCHIFRDHSLCFSKSLSTKRYTIWFCLDGSKRRIGKSTTAWRRFLFGSVAQLARFELANSLQICCVCCRWLGIYFIYMYVHVYRYSDVLAYQEIPKPPSTRNKECKGV